MREQVPDIPQVRPSLRRQTTWPRQIYRQPRDDHCNHTGGADHLFRPHIGQIRQGDGDRDQRKLVPAEQRHDPNRHAPRQPTGQRTTADQHGKLRQSIAKFGVRHAQHHEAHEQTEQRNSGGVVQQAFALDQARQPARRRDRAKDRDNGGRVSGRDDSTDQQAGRQGQGADPRQRIADRQRRHDHCHDSHNKNGNPVIDHTAQVHAQRRLKQKCRQKDI